MHCDELSDEVMITDAPVIAINCRVEPPLLWSSRALSMVETALHVCMYACRSDVFLSVFLGIIIILAIKSV